MLRVIFQPALPMRGVTSPSSDDRATVSFQPALPMRGVTMTKLTRGFTFLFQPALPMRGVTLVENVHLSVTVDFNPHSPCGE